MSPASNVVLVQAVLYTLLVTTPSSAYNHREYINRRRRNDILVLSNVFLPHKKHELLFIHAPRKSDWTHVSDYMEETCDPNGKTIDLSKETWLYGWIELVTSGG